jgi:hypothetical protein
MVIGGQAVLLYGEPRMTLDIDITLGVDVDELARVLAAVQPARLEILPADVHEFTRKTRVLPLRDPSSGIRVDLIFSFSAYEQEAIRRAKAVQIGDTAVSYASLEDLIVHKMVAGRPRDIEDVRGVLLRNPVFDRTYVLKWLRGFDAVVGRSISSEFENLINP